MRTSNGQKACLNCSQSNKPIKAECEIELFNFIRFNGVLELSKSLKRIHDLALYHTDIPIDDEEKCALFDLKILWENFEQIGKEV